MKEKLWGIQKMGSLKPGATYIYERVDGIVYAREYGKKERKIVGYNANADPERTLLTVWKDILKEAESNPALQKAIDRVILIYQTIKEES